MTQGREADTPLLRLQGAAVTFAHTPVLEPLTLSVSPGEFVAVVGPSGCGKSTLLRVAAGLVEPTGTVHHTARGVGFVFQDPTLMPWRTVSGNVRLMGELARMDARALDGEVERVLATVGLTEFADALPRELSGGMRMRASLARSLVPQPDLFLFDEPFGALDEITREQLNVVLMELFVDRGFGGLFVTHSVEEAIFLATRVIVLSPRPGRVLVHEQVPFALPRPLAVRYTPEFGSFARHIAGYLEGAL